MAVAITYLIMNIVRSYAIHSFIDNFLQKRRFPNWVLLFVYGIYYVVAAAFYLVPELFSLFHNVILNLSFAFLIGMLYQATYQKRLLCTVFLYILSIASDDCVVVIFTLAFQTSFLSLLNNTYMTILGIILSVSLMLGIIKLVTPLFKKQSMELNRSYWMAVFLIPSGCIYILHSLVSQLEKGKSDEGFALITILILFAINILVFYLYNKLLKEETTKYENMLLIQQNDAYEKQALLIQDFQKDMSGQRHDLNNHLSTVKELAALQQTDELIKYIDHWSKDVINVEPGIYTDNVVVNAMINSKLYMANLQKTTLSVNIDIPSDLDTERTDLIIILGNLFDNALEACTKLDPEDRMIRSDICHSHNTLTITVVNTCKKSQLDIRDGKAYTTKKDTDSHGIGLNRVQQIVEKYDGLFEYGPSQFKEQDIFVAKVMLYI